MKNTFKRMLATLLTVIMVFTSISVPGFAVEVTTSENTETTTVASEDELTTSEITEETTVAEELTTSETEELTTSETEETTATEELTTNEDETQDEFTWDFDSETGTLTISGTGMLSAYDDSAEEVTQMWPWGEHLTDIKAVVVEEGITGIGDSSLGYLINAESISLPSTLKSIRQEAFVCDCTLNQLDIPEGVTTIGSDAFECTGLTSVTLHEGLKDCTDAFCDLFFLKELTIPSSVENIGSIDYASCLETLNVKSLSAAAVLEGCNYAEEQAYISMISTKLSLEQAIQGQEMSEEELYAILVSEFNEKFNTSFSDVDSLVNYIENLENPKATVVYCYDNSAQHKICTDNYYSHILYGEEIEHTDCFVFSGTATDDNDNIFTWSIDTENRTLTVNGSGVMEFNGKTIDNTYTDNYSSWYYAGNFYDSVIIGEGITEIKGSKSFSSFDNISLPSSLNDIDIYTVLEETGVKTITVSEENSKFTVIDGVLYSKLTDDEINSYKTEYNIDSIGDLKLVYYPKTKSDFSISDRTSVIEDEALISATCSEITIPDSVYILNLSNYGHSVDFEKLNIGKNVRSVTCDWSMFRVGEINVDEDNAVYTSKDGCLYSKDLTVFYAFPYNSKITQLDIPESVTKITENAIEAWRSDSLKTVIIRNKDCEISSGAISGDVAICGLPGSTAYKYAVNRFYKFMVIFGSYPQTEITDEILKASLTEKAGSTDNWASYNYYQNGEQSDFMKYTDIEFDGEKYRGVYFTSYRPYYTGGDGEYNYQDDNGYNTSTIYWFKYEPILWEMLSYDATTDTAVVLSKSAIDSQEYYDNWDERTIDGKTVYANNYEYSNIRTWLNNTFYNTAFTATEKSAIVATTLDNSAYYTEYDSNSTTDNVWLLSYAEVQNADYGFTTDTDSAETRQAKTTDYAKSQGVFMNSENKCTHWRLRSAGYDYDSACHVASAGYVYDGSVVYYTGIGVRPALTLHLKSEIVPSCDHLFTRTPVAPTCTEKGYNLCTCTKCGFEYNDNYIAPLGHDYVTNEDPAPTCTTVGTKKTVCSRCGDTKPEEELTALGHSYSEEWTVDTPETCTTDGSKSHHCIRCGEKTDITTIPKTGHRFTGTSKTDENGNTLYLCENCNEYVTPLTGDTFDGFGSYPQTEVTDETLKASLNENAGSTDNWTSYNYYIDGAQSDYMKYTDIELDGEKYRGVYFTSYRPYYTTGSIASTYQDDNGYNTSTIYWFKYEPIIWQILSYDSATDNAVVLSKTVIDSQEYYDNTNTRTIDGKTVYSNNYEYSNIRTWLNNTFYNTAFTSSEKSAIVATTLDNSGYRSWYNSNSTTDNVWLLSYAEVQNANYGFTTDRNDSETRHAKPTDYAKSQGICVDSTNKCSHWRLRSAGSSIYYACNVDSDGCVCNLSSYVGNTDNGVRPALTLHLKSEIVPSCDHLFARTPVAPTCTEKGYNLSTCTKCGFEYKDNYLAALGHSWGSGTVTTEPTCIEKGVKTYTCTRTGCTVTKTEKISALGHDLITHEAKVPTCTETGWDEYQTCSRCDYTTFSEKLGHNIVKHDAKAPTCTEVGWNAYENCTLCDYTTYVEIPATGHEIIKHEAKAPTCTAIGWDAYDTCARCDYTTYVEIPATGHDYTSEQRNDNNDSFVLFTCGNCGDTYIEYDPAAAVALSASGIINGVTLSWTAAIEPSVTGYNLYRSSSENGEYTLLTSVKGTSYTDKSVEVGTEYFYKIMALKGSVEGTLSDIASAVPLPDTIVPNIKSVTPAAYSVISKTVSVKVAATDNVGIVKYEAYYTTSDSDEKQMLSPTLTNTGCAVSFDTTAVPDGVISFTVAAYDAMSNVSEQTLTYKIDNTGPDTVSAFKVIALHPTQLTLSWEKPLDEDLAYFVLEQKCGDNITVLNSNFNSLGYNVLNLTPDTEYSYRVKCVDQYGNEGEYTDWLTVTTTTDTTAPVVTSQSKNAGAYNKSVTYSATVKDDYAIKSIDIEYSYDKVTWTKIDGFEYGVDNKTANVSLPIDLTAYNEGSIYIRAVGTDKFGNVGDTSENAPFVEYLIDRTAPDSVDIKSTVVTDKTITVNWNACTATDVKSYSVYRSTSADGEYKCIAGNIKYLNYNDTSVSRNTEYFYKVAAVDNAGNVGELGNYGSAYVYEDAIAPNIASVSPKNTTIGPVNKTVSIFATDNDNLKNIIVEMKTANDTDFSVYKTFDVSGASKTVTFNMPLESFSHGDTAQIRVKAVDAVGLSSDTVTCSYTIDKLAPNADALSVVGNEGNAVVTWKDCGEGDLSGFEIYRCTGTTETRIASRSVNTSGSYKITDTAEFESVRYRIDAVDRYGNKNSFYSVSVSTVVILNPNVTLPDTLETETSLAFSAASTKSYYGVSEYKWSFSDGVTLTGATVYRKFDTAGSYSVTLTVADVQGNTKEKVTYFNIKEKVKTGKLKVTITDTNGYAISGCNVYLDVGSDNVETIQASSSGIAVKELPAGTHEIGAYLDGYLPDTKTVVIENDKTTEVTFKLTKQNIVTGEFKVREMTFEEIKEKGIDINNPDNQQIYEVNVTLIYGEQKIPVTYYRTNTEIKNYVIKDSGGTASNGVKYEYKLKYIPNKQNKEIIAVVRLPIHASYLKQFFLATLTIINNASEDFELVDCTTDITIPDGLTLMDRTPISSTIKGGSCDSETLVLRGDKAGEYNLSAKFSGTLKGFNENITASFESNSFKVYDKNTVKLVIEIPEQTEGRFRFNIGLENTRESDVYCPQINIDGMVTDITEMYKKTLQNRTDISDSDIKAIGCQALDSFVRDSDGKVTLYSEKGMPVDKIEPGQGVFVEYETISMLADGASGYFSDAIIDIEDALGGFVEIRYIGTINVDENTYIKEHIDFINGSDYGTASYDIASDMKDSIKNSAEYVELQILDLEGTLSTWAEEFTSALGVSNEFNDALCADYIEKLIDNATESGNIELKFFENLKEIINDVTDVISIPDDSTVDKDLWKNKIDGILEGTDYDSDTNKLFNSLLGKYMKDETIDRIYGKYDNINNILSIYQECNSLAEGIKKLNVYCAAVATYQELSDEIKDILIRTADEVENEQLKSALQRYANTAIDGAALKEELRGAAKQFFIQNAYDFFNFSYGSILKKAIKKFAVNKLASVLGLSASAVSADLSLSLMVITAARKILVAASGADKKRAAIYMLIRLSDVTSASAKVLEETKTELLSERDIKSALSFDAAYKMFKQWNLMAYDAYEDYGAARTDNFLEKYIVKKNRQKNLDGLADIISMKNIVNGIFCHSRGHEYGTDAKSKNTKVVAVACPVDVKLYSHDGTLAAQVISNEATVYDESVSCMVIDDTKLFAVPSELDYRVEITATGDGTMDYTVMEYSDNTETRKVTFPTQSIVTGDVFTGSTGVNKTEEVPVYALTKNSTETINAENAVDIIATGITVDKEEISLDIGNTDTVTATVETVGDDSYILYSDDDSICTVDENGVITAVGVGETDIYAASVDGGYIATTRVTVNEHKYDAGKVLSAATCTTEGKTLFTCTVCFATYTKTEPALGHAYGEWHTKSIPTCTENGTNERVCANNASHIETQTVAATGHIDNDNDGTCDNCGTDLGTNNPSNNCKHMCHKTKGILKFFWKIFNFFNKLFKIKQYCSCGAKHWQ